MNKNLIKEKITSIFRDVFNDAELEIKEDMTAKDVENWDSLSHMVMILEVEELFKIKFTIKELNKLKNVGDIINSLEGKLED